MIVLCLREKPHVGFPPVLSEVFFYLDIDFVDILFRVPQCYLFRRRTLFAYFKSLIISKGFKKWKFRNCFSKTGLNTSFSFY